MGILVSLLPVLVPLLGAIVLPASRRYRRARPFVILATLVLTLVSLIVAARLPEASTLFVSQPSLVPDVDLRFDYNLATALFSGLALAGVLAWLLVENLSPGTRFGSPALVTLAGLIAFICADNWATLVAGWALADLGLLAWRLESPEPLHRSLAWRAFGLSLFGALAALAGAFIQLAGGSSLRLPDAALAGWSATLIFLAAWVRSGLFPFQTPVAQQFVPQPGSASYAYSARPGRSRGLHASALLGSSADLLRGGQFPGIAFSLLMGVYLLVRSQLAQSGDAQYTELLVILALFGVGATAILAVLQTTDEARLGWACWAAGAPLLLIPFLPVPTVHAPLAIWLGLGIWHLLVIGNGVRLLRVHTVRQPWRQVLWVLAILCAVGFPLTPGFFGRIGLYAAALDGGAWPYLLILPIVLTLALIPFWRAFFTAQGEEERSPTLVEYLGLGLLILPPVVEGIIPFVIISLFGSPVEDASAFAYDALLHAPNLLQPVILVLAVILPLPLAFVLARRFSGWDERLIAPARPALALLDLSLVTQLGIWAMDALSTGLRELSALIEQHPIGWALFAALWIALWLLNLH